ncbi:hypothetical protein An07g07720 [Aspergillus niger]|uniref:Uncharacterized protein n=2 Tax=Aspergillus niger TaxID=5061 RepID=A5AAX3_ASPNC|nr:hypothetical protein An07g07720 [Aspergillus niger]CAK39588.1 hypothetical protein An07g07720 [Aspergillus niger]
MYATAAPCCKFATIVLAVELRCDLFGAVASIRSMGPVCLGADSARLLRTLSELPGLSLAFSQSGTLQHGEVKVPSAKGVGQEETCSKISIINRDEQWQKIGPMRVTFMTFSSVIVEVAPRMNHAGLENLTHTCPQILIAPTNGNARKPSYPCRAGKKGKSESLSSHYQPYDSMFRWTHVPEARWGEEMDRQPAHPFLVLLWLLTPTRSHSLPAMIRQKVCRTRGNGSSCPKPLTFFVVELKIRPEREKYASPPPLPDWGGWDQKDDTSTSSTKGFKIPPVVVPSRCIISGTSQDSGRHDERKVERSIPILILTPSCGDGGKATNPMARSTGGGGKVEKASRLAIVGEAIQPQQHHASTSSPWIIVILLAVDDEDHRHSSESDTSLAVMGGPPFRGFGFPLRRAAANQGA